MVVVGAQMAQQVGTLDTMTDKQVDSQDPQVKGESQILHVASYLSFSNPTICVEHTWQKELTPTSCPLPPICSPLLHRRIHTELDRD